MTDPYYESAHTLSKKSNILSWTIAAGGAAAAVLMMASVPKKETKPALPTTIARIPEVEAACSSGKARRYTSAEITVNGRKMVADCYPYWMTQGPRMPNQQMR